VIQAKLLAVHWKSMLALLQAGQAATFIAPTWVGCTGVYEVF
jgi:hypothetical protein